MRCLVPPLAQSRSLCIELSLSVLWSLRCPLPSTFDLQNYDVYI